MSKTLLLADDSATIQRVVELTFAQEDVRVVSVGDGEQAIRMIDRDRPDIVLADVGMPEMDGYEVATHIKQSPHLRNIPVLLLTGAFEPIDEEKAHRAACDGILIKPFEPRHLVARVLELLALSSVIQPHATEGQPSGRHEADEHAAAPPHDVPTLVSHFAAATPPAASPDEALTEAGSLTLPLGRPDVPTLDLEPLDAGLSWLDTPPVADRGVSASAAHEASSDPERLEMPTVSLDSSGDHKSAAPPEPAGDREPLEFHAASILAAHAPLESMFAREAAPASAPAEAPEAHGVPSPEPLEPPTAALWSVSPAPAILAPVDRPDDHGLAPAASTPTIAPALPSASVHESPVSRPAASAPAAPITLASAFAALLAAEEQQRVPVASEPAMLESEVEEVIRRVLLRITDEVVRKVVQDAAERLIREEIERIKAAPEGQ